MTDRGTPITFGVTTNDLDVDGDAVTLDSAEDPAHGAVDVVDGQLVYTPDADFIGTDVFVYTAVDPHGAESTGRAHVGVGVFPPGAPAETIATIASTVTSAQPELAPATSSDGRYTAFATNLSLVSDDTNARMDIYLFDRRTHQLRRVSVSSAGDQGNDSSQRPQLSADGRYIVFESFANNWSPATPTPRWTCSVMTASPARPCVSALLRAAGRPVGAAATPRSPTTGAWSRSRPAHSTSSPTTRTVSRTSSCET
jgi:hypothetical protein